jgi:anti-anti-sigma factor
MQVGRSESLSGCRVTWSDARVVLSGEIDELNADEVADRLRAGLTSPVTIMDLSAVTFFSAAGVRCLGRVGAAASAMDAIVRVTCSPHVWRIMDVCGGNDMPGLMLDQAGDRAPR